MSQNITLDTPLVISPAQAAATTNSVLTGKAQVVSGAMLSGLIIGPTSGVFVKTYNNTYPVATGETIYLSGSYLI